MFELRDHDYLYRIMAIDNGSSFLGLVILDMDLRTGVYDILHTVTYDAVKMLDVHKQSLFSHSPRWARQCTLQDQIRDDLEYWSPDAVVVEGFFFMPGRVTSFETLTEMMVFLRQAVQEYSGQDLYRVSPGEAKKAVQSGKFTMKKVVIPDCIRALDNLRPRPHIDLNSLTEHEYDAIAVGVAHGERIRRDTGFVR